MRRPRASTRRILPFHIIPIFGQLIVRARKRSSREPDNFFANKNMPQVPIIMPQLGESIAEATVVALKVQPGDKVVADQEIIEVETNKAVMSVTTPCAGEIKEIIAQVKETYPIGAVLGYVEGSETDAAKFAKKAPDKPADSLEQETPGRADDAEAMPRKMKT